MVSFRRVIRWPVERAPFWVAHKVPLIKKAALGVSRVIERILPPCAYTAGLSIAAYSHFKNIQKLHAEKETTISLVIGKGAAERKYTAVLRHQYNDPHDIAQMFRLAVRSAREFSRKHGDPQVYFSEFFPRLVSIAANIDELRQYVRGAGKLIDSTDGTVLPVYLRALALMVPSARKTVAQLIEQKKVKPEDAFSKYFEALDKKAKEVLLPPEYFAAQNETGHYLVKTVSPLLKVFASGADFVIWTQEIKARIDAFSKKYTPEPPKAYAKFLVIFAVKLLNLALFKAAADRLDCMLEDYGQRFGRHVQTHSFYLEALYHVLRKHVDPEDKEAMDEAFLLAVITELEKWDKAVKLAMGVCLAELIKIREGRMAVIEGQGVPHAKAAEITLKTLAANFSGFLSMVIVEMVKRCRTPEELRQWILKTFPDFRPPSAPGGPAAERPFEKD